MSVRRTPADRRWLQRWILVVSLGEALGFMAPAAVGVLASASDAFPALLLTAGAVEGALLGTAQAMLLRQRIPRLGRGRWVLLTAAAAVAAYAAWLTVSTTADAWTRWPVPARVALIAAASLVVLLSIGSAQWLELRRHLGRAARWLVGTAVAWLVALAVFLVIATPLWEEGQPAVLSLAIGAAAGLAMAVTAAAITGFVAVRLRADPRRRLRDDGTGSAGRLNSRR